MFVQCCGCMHVCVHVFSCVRVFSIRLADKLMIMHSFSSFFNLFFWSMFYYVQMNFKKLGSLLDIIWTIITAFLFRLILPQCTYSRWDTSPLCVKCFSVHEKCIKQYWKIHALCGTLFLKAIFNLLIFFHTHRLLWKYCLFSCLLYSCECLCFYHVSVFLSFYYELVSRLVSLTVSQLALVWWTSHAFSDVKQTGT